MSKYPKRGDIFWVQLDPTMGSEITKNRPCVIVSNNAANQTSPRVIVAPITSSVKRIFSFEVPIEIKGRKGKILLDQIRAIDKIRLGSKLESCDEETMDSVDEALRIALSID